MRYGNPHPCRVSFTDIDGLEHSVVVTAHTRNEAAVRAMAAFGRSKFSEQMPGLYHNVVLKVCKLNEESHEITVQQARDWLKKQGVPAEMSLKSELRELLKPKTDSGDGRRRSHFGRRESAQFLDRHSKPDCSPD